jgi:ABC-type dipeptide/oligopeptide/nickel transport system permease component
VWWCGVAEGLGEELAGEDVSVEEMVHVIKSYGYNKPIYIEYFDWVGSALQGEIKGCMI